MSGRRVAISRRLARPLSSGKRYRGGNLSWRLDWIPVAPASPPDFPEDQ